MHNSFCYYCAQKPCLQGNGVNIYTILVTVFSRHNCLIVTESWCKEMWQYSGMSFLNVSNYNLWALLTPTGENKITCAKTSCGVCNFRRLQLENLKSGIVANLLCYFQGFVTYWGVTIWVRAQIWRLLFNMWWEYLHLDTKLFVFIIRK